MVFKWFPCRFTLGLPQLSVRVSKVEDCTIKARRRARGERTSRFIASQFPSSALGRLGLWNSCINSPCLWAWSLQSGCTEEGAWSNPCCGHGPTPGSVPGEEHHPWDVVLASMTGRGFALLLPPCFKLTGGRWEIPAGVLPRAVRCSVLPKCSMFPWMFYAQWTTARCRGAVLCGGPTGTVLRREPGARHCSSLIHGATYFPGFQVLTWVISSQPWNYQPFLLLTFLKIWLTPMCYFSEESWLL